MFDYLFACPSFLIGVGRVFDLGGVFDAYNEHATPAEADAHASYEDWAVAGVDLRDAIGEADRDTYAKA